MSKDTDDRIQPVAQAARARKARPRGIAAALLVAAFGLLMLPACRSAGDAESAGTREFSAEELLRKVRGEPRHHALTIYGYNYTDRYMDDLRVNGESAANVDPSTPDAGGGKGVCCIGWTDGTPLPQTMEVAWLVGVCRTKVTNSYGNTRTVLTHRTQKATATLRGPIPDKPRYFEIHVYPDNHAEVAITAESSPPRLILDGDRDGNDYPDCPQ